jgi:hypothetical protein
MPSIGIKYKTEQLLHLKIIEEAANNYHCLWLFDKIAFVSEFPLYIKTNSNKQLHSDGSPAMEYKMDYKLWFLNGVAVTQEIAETPREELNAKIILTERNAEVRREIVRKIGIEKVINSLDCQVLDKKDNYELLSVDLQDGRLRPYLKMLNPSINTWHIEGVHPNCKTVEESLNWRNGTEVKPEILT